MRREVVLEQFPPQRIVSLVPSQTELLVHLGLKDRLVGVTKFCVHPEELRREKTTVGGTKQFRFEVIEALKPDLIIGNKEENYREGIEKLVENFLVWMSDIASFQDALDMITQLSALVGEEQKGKQLTEEITAGFAKLKERQELKALYLIWNRPYMAAGPGTFIDEMLQVAGFQNVVKASRYPEITEGEIELLNPDVVLLSSEPYPFKEVHMEQLLELLPTKEVVLVDGEMFSWYGSRLLDFPEYALQLAKKLKGKGDSSSLPYP